MKTTYMKNFRRKRLEQEYEELNKTNSKKNHLYKIDCLS